MPVLDVVMVRTIECEFFKYDYLNHTFYTSQPRHFDFELSNRFKNHTKYTIKPLNADAENTPHELKKDILDIERLFVVDFEKATESASFDKRTAVYEITSDAAPEIKCILTVVYDKDYVNTAYKK
jgi:hypothetical protein